MAARLGNKIAGDGRLEPECVARAARELLATEFPEVEVIPAVRELRRQVAPNRIGPKEKYSGVRKDPDPIGFLEKHYWAELRQGIVGPWLLQHNDQTLYVAVRRRVEAGENGMPIAKFLESYALPECRVPEQTRKLRACASILGSDEGLAARFFRSLRSEHPGAPWHHYANRTRIR